MKEMAHHNPSTTTTARIPQVWRTWRLSSTRSLRIPGSIRRMCVGFLDNNTEVIFGGAIRLSWKRSTRPGVLGSRKQQAFDLEPRRTPTAVRFRYRKQQMGGSLRYYLALYTSKGTSYCVSSRRKFPHTGPCYSVEGRSTRSTHVCLANQPKVEDHGSLQRSLSHGGVIRSGISGHARSRSQGVV